MRGKNKLLKHLLEKLKEAVFAVVPVALIVIALCLTVVDVTVNFVELFLIATVFLIFAVIFFDKTSANGRQLVSFKKNKIELWSKEKWDEINDFDNMDDGAECMSEYGLSF